MVYDIDLHNDAGLAKKPHRRIGLHLAGAELQILHEEVLSRLPEFRADRANPPTFHGGNVIGIDTLHLSWFASVLGSVSGGELTLNKSAMDKSAIDRMPGYRRRIRVEAGEGIAVAQFEDDYHCMSVSLEHDGTVVNAVIPVMERAPWTTCPGAQAKLVETFVGLALTEVTARREKLHNCTHLHDLAVLAAAHAQERGEFVYDILVSDPVAGERILEIRRDGVQVMRWVERDGVFAEPEPITGRTLFSLRDWIADLVGAEQEAARLLQWASIVAHGRVLPPERMSRATEIPPNCYTFQPKRVASAERIGETLDFSSSGAVPLETFGIDQIERARRSAAGVGTCETQRKGRISCK